VHQTEVLFRNRCWQTVISAHYCWYVQCVSKKTGPLQLVSHHFTNSQGSLIIFGTNRPYSIVYDKKFLNWLRTSYVFSITTIVTWHIWTANFWADFEYRIIDRVCQCWKTAF